jgi:hypothetical protein
VRKQYHLRAADDGFDAWDVDRLVELVRDLPTFDLPLTAISELDEDYWYGAGDVPTVRSVVQHWELAREVDPSHPIIVDPTGRVMDGMHRVARALSEGRTLLPAKRLPALPPPDFAGVRDPAELPY